MKKYLLILLSISCFGQFNPTTWHNLSGNYKLNTFIGGIGGTINTKELLAYKLGIPAYRIKKFKVTGVDIECAIVGGYNIPDDAFFLSNANITYFHDYENVVEIGLSAFRNTTSLISCIFLKANIIHGNGSGGGAFRDSSINSINAPNVTTFTGDWIFNNCDSLESIDFPLLTSNIQGYTFTGNSSINYINLPLASGVIYTSFQNLTSINSINLNSILNLGGTVGNDNIFNGIKIGCTITVPIAMQTINGGAPDGDLQFAITSRGANVIYVP